MGGCHTDVDISEYFRFKPGCGYDSLRATVPHEQFQDYCDMLDDADSPCLPKLQMRIAWKDFTVAEDKDNFKDVMDAQVANTTTKRKELLRFTETLVHVRAMSFHLEFDGASTTLDVLTCKALVKALAKNKHLRVLTVRARNVYFALPNIRKHFCDLAPGSLMSCSWHEKRHFDSGICK